MLTCQELVELITDYLEGAMTASLRAQFQQHISGCEGCDGFLQQMQQVVRATGAITEEQLDPTLKDRLMDAFRTWKSEGTAG